MGRVQHRARPFQQQRALTHVGRQRYGLLELPARLDMLPQFDEEITTHARQPLGKRRSIHRGAQLIGLSVGATRASADSAGRHAVHVSRSGSTPMTRTIRATLATILADSMRQTAAIA